MSAAQVIWGAFALTYGAGVTLTHLPTGADVYLQPGDDANSFLDEFDKAQNVAPDCPIDEILARLWGEYQ